MENNGDDYSPVIPERFERLANADETKEVSSPKESVSMSALEIRSSALRGSSKLHDISESTLRNPSLADFQLPAGGEHRSSSNESLHNWAGGVVSPVYGPRQEGSIAHKFFGVLRQKSLKTSAVPKPLDLLSKGPTADTYIATEEYEDGDPLDLTSAGRSGGLIAAPGPIETNEPEVLPKVPAAADVPRKSLNSKMKGFFELVLRKSIAVCLHMQACPWSELMEDDFDGSDIVQEFHVDGRKVVASSVLVREFRATRARFKIKESEIVQSVCLSGKLSGGLSSGKSGSFFFISPDRKFVLKSVNSNELKVLQDDFMRDYLKHIEQFPNTLLPRFYGVFKITTPSNTYKFILMNNVFDGQSRIDVIYDLKGSRKGRAASAAEKSSGKMVIHKDIDFEENKRTLWFERSTQSVFTLQLETDVNFLQAHNVMDYSLLLGIHLLDPEEIAQLDKEKDLSISKRTLTIPGPSQRSIFQRELGGIRSRQPNGAPMMEVYYIGIIDVLQRFNFSKMVESSVKSVLYDANDISAVDSVTYGTRFLEFIRKGVGTDTKLGMATVPISAFNNSGNESKR
eukprot:TRINITY_DN13459_c0_g1_i1.p1 TRINITY_DN13459_c0_g1~~TRINITY_DN13459_c0_g1_i1.p1  ORF type:complete len:591 (-),score=137.43 TRINITY_DN13459_c0_g1_i1:28-1734(-)